MHSRLSKHIKHRNICYFGWVLQISQDRKISWNYIQAFATQCQAFSLLGFCSFWNLREIQQRKAMLICLKMVLLLCSLSETRIDNGEKLNLTAASSHKRFHKSVPSLIDIVPTIEQRLLQPSNSIFSNLFDQHANLWFLFASGKNCMKQIILGLNFVLIFDFL